MHFASLRTGRPGVSRSGLHQVLARTLIISGLLAGLHAAAYADELSDVSQLLRAGQPAQALSRADAYLAKHPRDPQMRFLKGVILTEQNRRDDAIAIFTKLTEDYPALPEPYNNLAVLYAAKGEYEKARIALDKAIHTNPTYATAYENLGDVHAKLASEAYDKALQLDSGNADTRAKLTMIRSLVGSTTGIINPAVATVASTPVEKAEPAPEKQVEKAAPAQPAVAASAPSPSAQMDAQAQREAALKRQQEQKQEAEAARRQAQAQAAKEAKATEQQVLASVDAWARAWSARDVKAYLDAYAPDFDLPAGQSRKAWSDERRARIEDKKRISVKVESPRVAIDGNTATVRFRQVYDSDRLKTSGRKTLVLVRQGSKWRIKQERAGS